MGAGTGYWAFLLRSMGVEIQAYDAKPVVVGASKNPFGFTHKWTGVLKGRPQKLKHRPNHTLFLCWPDYDTPFAYDCLKYYLGNIVVYVGEGSGGCTGDDAFHLELQNKWKCEATVILPQWIGIHDYMEVFTRK